LIADNVSGFFSGIVERLLKACWVSTLLSTVFAGIGGNMGEGIARGLH